MDNIKNSLVLKNINYKVNNQIILEDINLDIKKGDFVSLLGESGSGKSTILKIIAGIIENYNGDVFINEKNVNKVKTKNRKACIVFQDYLLFPHLNVYENIAFGLRAKKEDNKYIDNRVKELIELTKLEDCKYKYENQLSGGQRQRVAIARALAINPDILLLDEPFSSLDDSLKDSMRNFLMDIRKKVDITTLLVTHDKKEAFFMSKKIAVLMDKKIISYDKPFNLYKYPKTKKLADFLEERNYISGYINDDKFYYRFKSNLDYSYKKDKSNIFKEIFKDINKTNDGYLYNSFDLNYIKSQRSIYSFSEENLFELCDHIKCDLMINKENIKIYSLEEFYKKYDYKKADGFVYKDYDYKKVYKDIMIFNNNFYKELKTRDNSLCENKYEYMKLFMGLIKKIKFRGSKMSYYIKVLGFLDFYVNIDIDSNQKFSLEDVVILKIELKDVLFFDKV